MYDLLVDRKNAPKKYFKREPDGGMKDLEKTVSFAMTFLFSFWLAGITGYCMGRYFFEMAEVESMKLAIAFIVLTIVVETGLFIIKVGKMTEKERRDREIKEGKGKKGREKERYEGVQGLEKKVQ